MLREVGLSPVAMVADCELPEASPRRRPWSRSDHGRRQRILECATSQCDERKEGLLVLGDMNAKDEEVRALCQDVKLQETRYAGA